MASNTIDGGVTCLPGRFGVFRSSIYASSDFLCHYLNEYSWWFGKALDL